MAEIELVEPRHSKELLDATEKTLAAHDLRLRVGTGLSDVLDSLETAGFKVSADHGYLNASSRTAGFEQPAHVNQLFEGLAKQKAEFFYPRQVGNVRSRDEMDRKATVQYIAEFGLKAFEALPATAATAPPVVFAPDRLTATQYKSLDVKTKTELISAWGVQTISAILARTK